MIFVIKQQCICIFAMHCNLQSAMHCAIMLQQYGGSNIMDKQKKEKQVLTCPICHKTFIAKRPWQRFDNPKCRWIAYKKEKQNENNT